MQYNCQCQRIISSLVNSQTCFQMQLEIGLICALVAILAVQPASLKDAKCAEISEAVLLKQDVYALPTEHQWLARITYENGHESKLKDKNCLGALISKRNVLAPAHCFLQYDGNVDAYSVQLGVYNKSVRADEPDCDVDGYCVLPAQDIPLEEIAIHPEYDPLTLKNSIAVLTLKRDVQVTPNVLPICMPPESVLNETLINQFYMMAGLPIQSDLRHKTGVNTVSRRYCTRKAHGLITSGATFCGVQVQGKRYYVGAPLVGLQVKSDELQNYYLAGLLFDSRQTEKPQRIMATFLDIRPYLSFIYRNAQQLTVNT